MAIVASDWIVPQSTKIINYIGDDHDGTAPSYSTVIDFHRWLQSLADDAVASGDDELDMTKTDPSRRSTDNIITLINGYTITAAASEHLYDGSIIYNGGDDIYDGIVNFGNTDVLIQIIQNGAIISNDWWNHRDKVYGDGGINYDDAGGQSHRFMIKTRTGGTDIDGRRIFGISRTFGNTYSEFKINGTSRGNNVLALSDSSDLNNTTLSATVAGWTSITNTNLGYIGLDADNNGADEFYYSAWDRDSFTINQFFERTKWLSQGPEAEDICVDSGSNFIIDNATITGAAQSFSVNANSMLVTKVKVNLKIGAGSPTGDIIATIFTHSGTYGTSSVPNTQTGIASDPIDSALLTSGYESTVFNFPTPVPVSASTKYCIVLTHADGGAGDYVHIEGLASSGTHSGNRSHNTAGWTAVAADDLAFEVVTSASLYGIPGALFRGITHEITVDTATGTFNDFEEVSWATGSGQMFAIDSTTAATKMWIQLLTGVAPTDGQVITGTTSSATVAVNVTVLDRSATISTPFIGASTGTALIGAYGVGLEVADLTSSDKVTSLANVVITPPNYVINTISGLVIGEDRVLVAPWDGVSTDSNGDPAINKNQFLLNTTLSTDNIVSVVVKAGDEGPTIPSDTPSAGYLRVTDDNGFERRLHYSSWTGSTFTIDTTDGNEDFATINASADNNVYLSYIDELATATTASFTSVQAGTRNLVAIVRDGGGSPIKQFISSWSQSTSSQTLTAIRTTDL